MSIDFEIAMEMQRIITGETRQLSRGQIASQTIDIDAEVKSLSPEREAECRAFYEELLQDDENKMYDIDMLVEDTETIKEQWAEFLAGKKDTGSFQSLFDAISDFFMTPPFEGLDSIEYGVNEVCVFSILEYFLCKGADNGNPEDNGACGADVSDAPGVGSTYDHAKMRADYRDSIAARTYEEVADHWIGVYDALQNRYDKIGAGFEGDDALDKRIAACSIVAIAAIRDQDDFALDMAQAGAETKGAEIMDLYLNGSYKEDESAFTDNVVKLYEFVRKML